MDRSDCINEFAIDLLNRWLEVDIFNEDFQSIWKG